MQDPIIIGALMFALFVAPFLTYTMLSWIKGTSGSSTRVDREDRAPSTTGSHPSRTIPGSKSD